LRRLDECLQRLEKAAETLSAVARDLRQLPQISQTPAGDEAPAWAKETTQLKTGAGDPLATFYSGGRLALIRPAQDKVFSEEVPPFRGWFVEKVLEKMRQKDEFAANNGLMPPEDAFTYTVLYDKNRILEIELRNISPERIKEIKTSVRWTLERMLEKQRP
jgi:hypothetical protein